jgi:hypothetical protein
MTKIRRNEDIKYIIIHHTGHVSPVSAERVNNEYIQVGDYGAPYDVLIDMKGVISSTPRWNRFLNKTKLEPNISPSIIFKNPYHYYSSILPYFYRTNSFNIGVIGNYDIEYPSSFIFRPLISILEEAVYHLGLSLQTSLLYHTDIYNTTSPGVFFYDKYFLIKYVTQRIKIIDDSPYENPVVDTNIYRLLEDGTIRLLEDGSSRLLESSP